MPLKVLHVIPSVSPLRGGPSVMVRRLAQGLAEEGVDVHVATTNDDGQALMDAPCERPVTEAGVTYWYFARQSRLYTFSWPLSEWLRRNVSRFDAVHIHALFSFAALPASVWAARAGVPYIVRPLGTLNTWGMQNRRRALKHLSLRLIENRILAHAAMLHYTSGQERQEAESLPIPRIRSVVIPNPVPTVSPSPGPLFRDRHPHLHGKQIVLFLSRIDVKKGLDLLIAAIEQVRRERRDFALVIAGHGDETFVARVKEDVARRGLSDCVTWAGFVQGADKAALLHDADLFVLPSYSENFGIAVAEAMAAGVPVVVSDQVALHGDVIAAGAGQVVRCDAGELAQGITSLLADPARLRSCGDRGRAFVAEHLSVAAVARQVADLYRELSAVSGSRLACAS